MPFWNLGKSEDPGSGTHQIVVSENHLNIEKKLCMLLPPYNHVFMRLLNQNCCILQCGNSSFMEVTSSSRYVSQEISWTHIANEPGLGKSM